MNRIDKKKRRLRPGLKWRLFASFSIFTIVLLTILWVCQTVLLGTIYRGIKTDSLKKCVDEIAYQIKKDDYEESVQNIVRSYDVNLKIVDENYEPILIYAVSPTNVVTRISGTDLFMLCERAEENGGTYVQVFQQYMKEIHGNNTRDYSDQRNDYPDFKTGSSGKRGFLRRSEPPIFPENDVLLNMISTKVAKLSDGSECYIIVDSVITPVDDTVKTLMVMLLHISVITLIIALIIAFVLARKIAKPITKMNKNAALLAKGDFTARFDSKGYAEIEQLSETMNYAARELSRADELRRELIANVSHDLRTPLTMIVGYSEVMRDIPGENSPENIQVIIDEAERLSSLVNDLLDISRLQAGTNKITVEKYNITQSIKEIISRFDKLMDNEGFDIAFRYDTEVFVNADENRIAQVIYNLIINAINYAGKTKLVSVEQKLFGSTLRIEITDTGEGISKEDLPYIWDRYYRVDKTHKRAQMGTGLGLSIVKTVLESHGAVYGVDSTLGVGSTFWFELDGAMNVNECEQYEDQKTE